MKLTIKQKQDLSNIAYDFLKLFYNELVEETEARHPLFKRRLKSYLFRWFDLAEFELNLKDEALNSFCNFLEEIYNLILKRLDKLQLE